jgi:hypothetical protein
LIIRDAHSPPPLEVGRVKNKTAASVSGNWWTSTQYNATNGVNMNNGQFNNNNKNNNYNLLPALAYY